jgi:hypothetical protein
LNHGVNVDSNVSQPDTIDQSENSSNDPDAGQTETTFQTWTSQQLLTAVGVGLCTIV